MADAFGLAPRHAFPFLRFEISEVRNSSLSNTVSPVRILGTIETKIEDNRSIGQQLDMPDLAARNRNFAHCRREGLSRKL